MGLVFLSTPGAGLTLDDNTVNLAATDRIIHILMELDAGPGGSHGRLNSPHSCGDTVLKQDRGLLIAGYVSISACLRYDFKHGIKYLMPYLRATELH